ncbi:glycosyl hydrolase family 17 protein [Aliiglaciecola sp. M165]|uniref:glycosyl hydrolase family 17 protein n=1 Tax=Aliiglaciecola sp. M165 TaxID=2593649 RepID=UPI0021B0A7D3|nr:glycosyl hydrolase family 17 protein [Aliiglaciecola sp. M165]
MRQLIVITFFFGIFGFHFQAMSMAQQQNSTTTTTEVFNPMLGEQWIGLGIAYGSYRDGESPGKGSVSSEQDILEDMLILTHNGDLSWNLIRMYAADAASEQVLKVIRKHQLPVRVVQGAWLSSTQTAEENEQQISEVIRLANEYKDIIVSVNLGNEIFVDWSAHKLLPEDVPKYISWVKKVQNATRVPVTLADDYNFWNKPWSQDIAQALDYIVLHAYAMWNSQTLDNAVAWTEKTFNDIKALHPNKQIVLGESGWATSSISTNGDERLIIGEASEKAQKVFFETYRQWLLENKIVSFYFEAFDEKWKGGEDKPDGIAEKNWGLFKSDRSPKLAVDSLKK